MPDVVTPSPMTNYTCNSCKIVFWINKGLELYPCLSSANRILGRTELNRFLSWHVSMRLCVHPHRWTVPDERGGGHAPFCFCSPNWVTSWNRKLYVPQLLQSNPAYFSSKKSWAGFGVSVGGDFQQAVLAVWKWESWWEVAAPWPSPFWEILAHANIQLL